NRTSSPPSSATSSANRASWLWAIVCLLSSPLLMNSLRIPRWPLQATDLLTPLHGTHTEKGFWSWSGAEIKHFSHWRVACCHNLKPICMPRLPFDPITEARSRWIERGWSDAADGMAFVTSIFRVRELLLQRLNEGLKEFDLTFARYEVLM